MKLNPKNYSLKQATADLESCNRLIIEKSEHYVILKKEVDVLNDSVRDLVNKKIYIKKILRQKSQTMKNWRSKKRIGKLLKK